MPLRALSRIVPQALVCGALLLTTAPAAFAQNPTAAGYGEIAALPIPPAGPTTGVSTAASSGSAAPGPASTTGSGSVPGEAGNARTTANSVQTTAQTTSDARTVATASTPPVPTAGSKLPFTGADAVLLTLAALALLSIGVVLRRSTRLTAD